MSRSAYTIFLFHKANIYKALIFALAILVLLVSCPVKRLVLTNFDSTSTSSSHTKSSRTNSYQGNNVEINATATCSIEKDKSDVVESDISQKHKLHLPLYLANINAQSGFNINYFLSRIDFGSITSIYAQHVTLPLYLQHLRLRI